MSQKIPATPSLKLGVTADVFKRPVRPVYKLWFDLQIFLLAQFC